MGCLRLLHVGPVEGHAARNADHGTRVLVRVVGVPSEDDDLRAAVALGALMALISRRDVFRIAGGSLATGGSLVQAAQPPATSDGIEPNAIKRRGTGFRGIDKARAYPGFTLFAPIAPTNRTVYLIDMEGKIVHRWEMPYAPGLHGYLTERGTLFYNAKI